MAFMPLQQLKLHRKALARRFRLTGMIMTNHSTDNHSTDNHSIDTKVALLVQQGKTITATLARMEQKQDVMDNKLLVVIIILTAVCTFLAKSYDESSPLLG